MCGNDESKVESSKGAVVAAYISFIDMTAHISMVYYTIRYMYNSCIMYRLAPADASCSDCRTLAVKRLTANNLPPDAKR